MNRLRMFVSVMIALLALVAVQGVQPAQARAAEPSPACAATALRGSYEFVASPTVTVSPGTVIAIPDRLLAGSPVPFDAKGTLTFGAGRVVLGVTQDTQGQAATPKQLTGDTILNGCALTATFADGSWLGVRIVNNGAMQFPVSTTPGFVILRTPQTFQAAVSE